MTDKVVNYTDEMVAKLHAGYDGTASVAERDAQIAQLADEVGRSAASVRAKLTREGIYVPKGPAPKKGRGESKAEIVSRIAVALDADEDVIGSLEKATKVALYKVLDAI